MRRLIIRPGAIGDFIVSLPALEFLRADYTEVWCSGPNVPLARFADRAFSIAAMGLDRVGVTHCEDVLARLAAFDSIVSWYGAKRAEFRETVTPLAHEVRFYNALPPEHCGIHAIDFYLNQVCAPDAPPALDVPPAARAYIAIHPFSGSPRKNWPLAHFQELAALLAPHDVRFCRGPEEHLPGATYIPDLYDLALWLSQARLYIGNDSGITHLAAATGTPTLALFGPTDPAIWAPRGPNVTILSQSLPILEVHRTAHNRLLTRDS